MADSKCGDWRLDNGYRFVTRWRVEGTCGEVADILGDPLELTRWWPSVYLDAREIEAAREANGVGRRVRLLTKGWLPYTLRWEFVVTEARYPSGFRIEAGGDLVGTGVWTFEQDGPTVDVIYDWRIRAEKPLLRRFSAVLRPIFEANHRWAMSQGEKSLQLELARRRTPNAEGQAAIPPPPGPVTYAAAGLVAGAVLVGTALTVLMYRASVRNRRASNRRRLSSRRPGSAGERSLPADRSARQR
jgi:hypothetical protein